MASAIQERLRKAPIFPSLRVAHLGPGSRQSDVTPPPRIHFSTHDAKMWVQAQLFDERDPKSTGDSDRDQGGSSPQRYSRVDAPDGEGERSGRRRESRKGGRPAFGSLASDPYWAMDASKQGRRVVVRGVPGMASYELVRKIAKNFGVLEGEEGCVRMPP